MNCRYGLIELFVKCHAVLDLCAAHKDGPPAMSVDWSGIALSASSLILQTGRLRVLIQDKWYQRLLNLGCGSATDGVQRSWLQAAAQKGEPPLKSTAAAMPSASSAFDHPAVKTQAAVLHTDSPSAVPTAGLLFGEFSLFIPNGNGGGTHWC